MNTKVDHSRLGSCTMCGSRRRVRREATPNGPVLSLVCSRNVDHHNPQQWVR